ncbi:MAG: flagellar hook-associated protein FlgK [Limisphaerales bacterium]
MLGLFGALNMGTRALQTQRQGVEVAGHNLANVNNPVYARQRISISSTSGPDANLGSQGAGADVASIQRLRSQVLDNQIVAEDSVQGSLNAQQKALEYAQADMGQQIDRLASGAEGASAAQGVGGAHSLSSGLSELFSAFQSLSTDPSSVTERQVVVMKAANLATQFSQADDRLARLSASLDDSVKTDVSSANELLSEIARLNDLIRKSELNLPGSANDLRDTRQMKIESLAGLVKVDAAEDASGMSISINGTTMLTGSTVLETLATYQPATGGLLVQTASGTPLALTGGSIEGTITARDGAIASLHKDVNDLASVLITEVNALHQPGFSLSGSTGAKFFTGSNATDIQVNSTIAANPTLIQVAGVAGAAGDNTVAVALGQLSTRTHPALNGQTLNEYYASSIASIGQSLSTLDNQVADQNVVDQMLSQQRDSVSGVSLDEEMTDMVRFQKAFEASARLISTISDMLDIVVNLKR